MKDYFFDIHCHIFNLSHPNLLLFVKRLLSEKKVQITAVLIAFLLLIFTIVSRIFIRTNNQIVDQILFYSSIIFSILFFIILILLINTSLLKILTSLPIINRSINLVSVMENNLGDFFQLMENDIVKLQQEKKIKQQNIIITPLMMDFGYKWVNDFPDIYYNKLSRKPITDQVIDLLNGIREYRGKTKKRNPIIEVYPFLGINTQNYPWDNESKVKLRKKININKLQKKLGKDKIEYVSLNSKDRFLRYYGNMDNKDKEIILQHINTIDKDQIDYLYEESNRQKATKRKRTTVKVLLNKYFGKFKIESPDKRHDKLFNKMGKFNGNIDDKKTDYNYFFAGIKVYPPLGFDPMPDDPIECKKVRYMYDMCIKKNIPITTHGAEGGFQVIENRLIKKYVYYNWEKVLDDEKYKSLKINFAHFGNFKYKYAKYIFKLILNHDNVYTDFSYKCFKKNDYKKLFKLINKLTKDNKEYRNKLLTHINFGTDFMINLLRTNSYYEYLSNFMDDKNNYFSLDEKKLFYKSNPMKFLF